MRRPEAAYPASWVQLPVVLVVLLSLFGLFIQGFAMGGLSLIAISNLTGETRQFQAPCGAKPTIAPNYGFEVPTRLVYDPALTVNDHNFEDRYLNFTLDSSGQASCWPWTASVRTTKVELWLHDSDGNLSWIFGCDVLWVSVLSQNPQTVVDVFHTCLDTGVGGGWKHVGWFSVNWPMEPNLTMKLNWDLRIFDYLAQLYQGDQVQFNVQVTLTYDAYNGWWWYGNNLVEAYNLNFGPVTLAPKMS